MSARKIPVDVAVRAISAVLPIARTWRFRHPDDPGRRFRPLLEDRVYACWHEHLLPVATLFAHQGVATLASRDRDGEIITRLLIELGYVTARGSSTRGGQTGFRQLLRAAAEGRPVIVTGDGPRGPRRAMKDGTPRLATHTGRAVVPVGMAATAGWRLGSWDRFLIPAPGATIYVALGDPTDEEPMTAKGLELAMHRETDRCELIAGEGRWSRPPRVRRPGGRPETESATEDPTGRTRAASSQRARPENRPEGALTDRRRSGGRLEGVLRRVWTRPAPSVAWAGPAAVFGVATRVRGRLYDAGVLGVQRANVPVISVGGVTVGGSGKTPFVGDVADRLAGAGHAVAILTRGYADEMALHKRTVPTATVWGHPDRVRIARRASSEGASVVVLDDGFQHRRLERNLDVLLLDRDALRRTNQSLLPAGPFRERWRAAVARADVVVLTGREPWDAEMAEFDALVRAEVASRNGDLTLGSLSFEPGELEPANRAARQWSGPLRPGLALTGIMKPNLFFDRAASVSPGVTLEVALRDHGLPAARDRPALREAASDGVLSTRKDLPRVSHLFEEHVPIWTLSESLVWRRGRDAVWRAIETAATP